MECIFCKIVNKELPAKILFENEQLMAFNDAHPEAPVHFLVIPKEHIQSIAHLGNNHRETVAEIIYAAKDIATKLSLKGYKLVFNVGREGGQIIDHLHLHVLGGWKQVDDRKKYWKEVTAGPLDT